MTTTTQNSIGAEIDHHFDTLRMWLDSIELAPGVNRQKYLKATHHLLLGFEQLREAIAPPKSKRLADLPPAASSGAPAAYRLAVYHDAQRRIGVQVLQGLFRWWDGTASGEEWRDLPTVMLDADKKPNDGFSREPR
jgi:hypothetical protein